MARKLFVELRDLGTNILTGRPGDQTMEIDGRSTASYLARTLCIPAFLPISICLEAKGLLDFQGRRGITSVVRWNLRPVIFGVERCLRKSFLVNDLKQATCYQIFEITLRMTMSYYLCRVFVEALFHSADFIDLLSSGIQTLRIVYSCRNLQRSICF